MPALDANAVVRLARRCARDAFDDEDGTGPKRTGGGAPLPGDLDALRGLVGAEPDAETLAAFKAAWREEWDAAAFDAWEEDCEDERLTMAEGPDYEGGEVPYGDDLDDLDDLDNSYALLIILSHGETPWQYRASPGNLPGPWPRGPRTALAEYARQTGDRTTYTWWEHQGALWLAPEKPSEEDKSHAHR